MENKTDTDHLLLQTRTTPLNMDREDCCLKKEISQLRDFFTSKTKERELLEGQINATHILCKRKLVKAEKELQAARLRLHDTENEAAILLESKQLEMERLQKEKDDAAAQKEHLLDESNFFKRYTSYLEEKLCALVAKLHEYHEDLRRKTHEIVETRARAVDELEWVKQTMLSFEQNLIEYHEAKQSQLLSMQEQMSEEDQRVKQSDISNYSAGRLSEGLTDAERRQDHTNQIIHQLQKRVRRLENGLECANERASLADSYLSEANATKALLRKNVSQLEIELQATKDKNLEYVIEKIKADAEAQMREVAISVLKLRIYALEGDLQARNVVSSDGVKTLRQLSPEINVEMKARRGLMIERDTTTELDYAAAKLEAAKYQLQEDAGTIKKLRGINLGLEKDLQRERLWNSSVVVFTSDGQ